MVLLVCYYLGDTFTTPTRNMMAAMLTATHGDDVYHEDETVNNFQSRVANLAGKEAGIFCVSGTLSNQIALRSHLKQPPHSILCDHRSHVYCDEAGGLATLSQAMVVTVIPSNDVYITLEDIKKKIRLGDNIHSAPTRVISLENTLYGTIMPLEEIARISTFAHSHDIKMHLDGARLWNASAATGIPIAEYCRYFDSISLCISKGLGAPIGSVLVGTKDFLKTANWFKKQNGGGIRQAGMLAAAANVAIDEVWPTMKLTHYRTKKVAEYFGSVGLKFSVPVNTNFIILDLDKNGMSLDILIEEAKKHNVKVAAPRLAFHHQTSDEAIENLKMAVVSAYTRSKKEIKSNDSMTMGVSVYGKLGN